LTEKSCDNFFADRPTTALVRRQADQEMVALTQCETCGSSVSQSVAGGQCPSCLMGGAIDTLRETSTFIGRPSVPVADDVELPGFEILELVGRGGMGAVYTARQISLDRTVAVKILPLRFADNPVLAERFVRESRSLARLNHPHIVTAFDAGVAGDQSYLVMEYVDGADLASLIHESGPVDPAEACEWIRHAADALAYTHGQGFVHRDIKPSNLLLDQDGKVQVSDLGLVGAAQPEMRITDSSLTDAGSIHGTVDFMAPEQAADMRSADERSDIYSLGCTLFYLLTGLPPYDGNTAMKRLIAHREQPIPSLSDFRTAVSPQLDTLVRRMLAKNPEDRPQTMAEVRDNIALEASAPDEPAETQRPRNSLWLALTTVVLFGLGAFVTYRIQADNGTLVVRINELVANEIDVRLKPGGLELVNVTNDDRQHLALGKDTTLPSGTWRIQPTNGLRFSARNQAGVELDADRFIIRRDERIVVEVTMAPAAIAAHADPTTRGDSTDQDLTHPKASVAGESEPAVAVVPFFRSEAREHQESWARQMNVPREIEAGNEMQLVLIPPGQFLMGSSDEDIDRLLSNRKAYTGHEGRRQRVRFEGPQRDVTLTKPFYLGIHEVTQQQYEAVTEINPSAFTRTGEGKEEIGDIDTDDFPVENVTWLDAARFCNRLSEQDGLPLWYKIENDEVHILGGTGYRLPTEAESEFACRAGTVTNTYLNDDISSVSKGAWVRENGDSHSHPVGSFEANPFGLFDMHGNVWEWCFDTYGQYVPGDLVDPRGAATGDRRVLRGGDFASLTDDVRSPVRFYWDPARPARVVGFRVARTIEPHDSKQATGKRAQFSIDERLNARGTLDAQADDLNGDGWSDLVVVGEDHRRQVSIFLNDGAGQLVHSRDIAGSHLAWGVELADLDGDQDPDIFVALWGRTPRVLLNDGDGQFESQPHERSLADDEGELRATNVAAGDVDGDGDIDMVTSFSGPEVAVCAGVWLNDGNAGFERGSELSVERDDGGYGVGLADLDGDSDLDLVCGTWSGRLYVAANDGQGHFEVTGTVPTAPWIHALALGDLDQDEDIDVCLTCGGEKALRVYLNNGDADFTECDLPSTYGRISGRPLLVDLDSDKDLDIVMPRRWKGDEDSPRPHEIWLNAGQARFELRPLSEISCESNAVAATDLDADGDVDLLFSTQFSDAGRIWLNQQIP
jgi:eukaryotic-like serine/threonine-protein kinase